MSADFVDFLCAGEFGRQIPEWGWLSVRARISRETIERVFGPIGNMSAADAYARYRSRIDAAAARVVGRLKGRPTEAVIITEMDFNS